MTDDQALKIELLKICQGRVEAAEQAFVWVKKNAASLANRTADNVTNRPNSINGLGTN